MTITSINNCGVPQGSESSIEAVKANLEAIARAHRISVPELLKSAESAGPGALPYLNRALVLAKRIEKLEQND